MRAPASQSSGRWNALWNAIRNVIYKLPWPASPSANHLVQPPSHLHTCATFASSITLTLANVANFCEFCNYYKCCNFCHVCHLCDLCDFWHSGDCCHLFRLWNLPLLSLLLRRLPLLSRSQLLRLLRFCLPLLRICNYSFLYFFRFTFAICATFPFCTLSLSIVCHFATLYIFATLAIFVTFNVGHFRGHWEKTPMENVILDTHLLYCIFDYSPCYVFLFFVYLGQDSRMPNIWPTHPKDRKTPQIQKSFHPPPKL